MKINNKVTSLLISLSALSIVSAAVPAQADENNDRILREREQARIGQYHNDGEMRALRVNPGYQHDRQRGFYPAPRQVALAPVYYTTGSGTGGVIAPGTVLQRINQCAAMGQISPQVASNLRMRYNTCLQQQAQAQALNQPYDPSPYQNINTVLNTYMVSH